MEERTHRAIWAQLILVPWGMVPRTGALPFWAYVVEPLTGVGSAGAAGLVVVSLGASGGESPKPLEVVSSVALGTVFSSAAAAAGAASFSLPQAFGVDEAVGLAAAALVVVAAGRGEPLVPAAKAPRGVPRAPRPPRPPPRPPRNDSAGKREEGNVVSESKGNEQHASERRAERRVRRRTAPNISRKVPREG